MSFVLAASVVLLWLVPDTKPTGVNYASAKQKAPGQSQALVPSLFTSAYDAAYLEQALRKGLPLATLDANLAKAATTAGVLIFGTH